MILPTSLLRVRISEGGKKRLNLWLPVFLVWPVVIALMIILAPVALLLYVCWPSGRGYILGGPRILVVLWAMRGLEVRVQDRDDSVLVSVK